MNRTTLSSLTVVSLAAISTASGAVTTYQPSLSAMTSGFFAGTDFVRGFAGDNRPTFRVSTDGAFGVGGAETIYSQFDFDPTVFTESVVSAVLTATSVSGGFNADAGAGNPFLVSAHGVDLNPFESITDDTNPTGTVAWNDFLDNNILVAPATAQTSIDSFGLVEFDVTDLINSWVAGTNSEYTIALTGKDDTSGNGFLHGFTSPTESPGASFLTVTTVPEPSSALLVMGACAFAGMRRRR